MPTLPHPRPTALLCAAALAVALGACGQKGALYHPEPADAVAAPAAPDAPAPAKPPEKKKDAKPAGAPR